jgi:hypothetical protein
MSDKQQSDLLIIDSGKAGRSLGDGQSRTEKELGGRHSVGNNEATLGGRLPFSIRKSWKEIRRSFTNYWIQH